MLDQLIQKSFAIRNLAHIEHWRATGPGSEARHEALGDFYDAVVGLVDDVVEAHQAVFGVIDKPVLKDEGDDIVTYANNMISWIEENRSEIAGNMRFIENLVDAITACVAKLVYKLENLQ